MERDILRARNMTTPFTCSDHSDEDGTFTCDRISGADNSSRRRSTRACDHCRRTKSKCERVAGLEKPCRGCTTLGLSCTYAGPSHKRGPPKGYIHAIERRLHQAEALLGAIIGCQDPRARSLLDNLSCDPLAEQIIRRVESGPFGPKGHVDVPFASTKQDFLMSISKPASDGRFDEPLLTRRQSRMSREELTTNHDNHILATPNSGWGDSLRSMLATSKDRSPKTNIPSTIRPLTCRDATIDGIHQRSGTGSEMKEDSFQNVFSATDTCIVDPCELSLDPNMQFRYHGKASVFYLLQKCCTTDAHASSEPQSSTFWPPLPYSERPIQRTPVSSTAMPEQDAQNNLIELYFSWVHPMFPVVHKGYFLDLYECRMRNISSPLTEYAFPDASFEFLLFAMFSLSSRFSNVDGPPMKSSSVTTDEYYKNALNLFSSTMGIVSPSTCQALLLMSYHDLGVGSGTMASIFLDMAIRTAQSLGMHRPSETVKSAGILSFSQAEQEMRVQTWIGCCILDKYIAAFIGRAISTVSMDFDVTSGIELSGDAASQSSFASTEFCRPYNTIYQYFHAFSRLYAIMSTIMEVLYSQRISGSRLQNSVSGIEEELKKWYTELPEKLRLDMDRSAEAAPVALLLHIQYWWTWIVLHRHSIYVTDSCFYDGVQSPEGDFSHTGSAALAQCQDAATHIVSIASAWLTKHSISRAPPFILACVLDAAVIFAIIFKVQPWNPQARLALQKCQSFLMAVKNIWPMAEKVLTLLHKALARIDTTLVVDAALASEGGIHVRGDGCLTDAPPANPYFVTQPSDDQTFGAHGVSLYPASSTYYAGEWWSQSSEATTTGFTGNGAPNINSTTWTQAFVMS